MRIELRPVNIQRSELLEAHVHHKIDLALRRFQDRVADVTIRIVDENGPRGGLDTRCRIVVSLVGGRKVVVQGLAEDAYAAVSRAAGRLHEQVNRAFERPLSNRALPRGRVLAGA
jgi:putative sigma-54 modulation protein